MAGNFGSIGSDLSVAAGDAIKRNAADNGWDTFTPAHKYVDRGDISAYDKTAGWTFNGSAQTLDLNSLAGVPVGAVAVNLIVHVKGALPQLYVYFRKYGYTSLYNALPVYTQVANIWNTATGMVAVDSSARIQYIGVSSASWSSAYLVVSGWWI